MKNKILVSVLIVIPICISLYLMYGMQQNSIKASQDILHLAEEVTEGKFIVASVPGFENALANKIVIGLSRWKGPSSMAKKTAKLFYDINKSTSILILGISDELTKEVLFNALKLNEGKNISGLKILYVGNEDGLERIKKLAEKKGVVFYHRPKP